MEEDVPGRVQVDPAEYTPVLAEPAPVPSLTGYQLPTTAVIRSFLGGAGFRIAITLSDRSYGVYVLEPGEPDQPPRILRYSDGREAFYSDRSVWYGHCRLSPDGKRLAYSISGGNGLLPSIVWMQNLEPGAAWRTPLFSAANRSHGMFGDNPYWHRAQGKDFIGFQGGGVEPTESALADVSALTYVPLDYPEPQMVEVVADTQVSPVFPVRAGGRGVRADIRGLSRDGRWILIRENSGRSYLLPAARAPDYQALRAADSLAPYSAGGQASLNPFDSAATPHSDYFAVPAFSVSSDTGNPADTVLDPRTLDGRRMAPGHPLADDNFWVCDAERRIHFSRKVGTEPLARVVWTTHPNFVLAMEGYTAVHLIRLADTEEEVLGDSEPSTRRADGVLTLFGYDAMTWKGHSIQDFSMWVEP